MSVPRHESVPVIRRVASAIASYIGFGTDEETFIPSAPVSRTPRPQVMARQAPRTITPQHRNEPHKWQRHAQLRAYTPPITPDVREARRLAVRGLYAIRHGAPDVGFTYFAEAAKCREVDLTAVPGFWDLTRGQMMIAVEAYEHVERYREMAALDAQIATIFRPTLVGDSAQPVSLITMKRTRASGD